MSHVTHKYVISHMTQSFVAHVYTHVGVGSRNSETQNERLCGDYE